MSNVIKYIVFFLVFEDMNRKGKKLLWIVLLVAVVVWIMVTKSGKDGNETKAGTSGGSAGRGNLPVSGIVAQYSKSSNGIPVNGSLLANEEVELVTEIVGKVRKIYFQVVLSGRGNCY